MKKLLFILMVALALPLYAADRVRYADTGSPGGDGTMPLATATAGHEPYVTQAALVVAELLADADLTGEGRLIVHLNRTNGGGPDTAPVTYDGFTTSDTCYPLITQDDFPLDGVPDESKYYLSATNATSLLISDNWVRIDKLQVKPIMTANNTAYGIRVALVGVSSFYFDKCLVWTSTPGTGNISGIYINNSSATVTIYDSIVTGFVNGTNTVFQGIRINSATAVNLYNNTIYNCHQTVVRSGGAVTVKNCIVRSTVAGNDFVGDFAAIANCLSDDGDGDNPQTPAGADWANEFTDAAGLDFSLVAGGNAIGHGVDDPGSGLYSDDIIGTARSSTWDIGAYEYAPTSPPTKAATPGPAHEAVGQTVNVNLTWVDGGGTITYDVYFGTDATPDADEGTSEFKGNQAGLSYDPGVLAYETEYFWRIDSVNTEGTTTGDVWSFTTGSAPAAGGTIGPIIYYRNRLRQR